MVRLFPEPLSLALATAVCCSVSARVFRSLPDRIGDWEREWCRDLYAASAALFAMTLVWLKMPPQVVALSWTLLGLAVFEIGARFAVPRFRLLAHLVAAAVCARLFVFEFAAWGDGLQLTYRSQSPILPILAAYYYIWWRYQRANILEWERTASKLYLYLSAILFIVLARFELGQAMAVVAWALFGLALFALGQAGKIRDLCWQSYAIALLSFFSTAEALSANHAQIPIGSVVIASFYGAQLLAPRNQHERSFYSFLASLLLAILLFYEVSGGMLTVVWSVEALALLGAGFPLRDRFQRLSGLALFYDLRSEAVPLRSAATGDHQPDSFVYRAGSDSGQRLLAVYALPRSNPALFAASAQSVLE